MLNFVWFGSGLSWTLFINTPRGFSTALATVVQFTSVPVGQQNTIWLYQITKTGHKSCAWLSVLHYYCVVHDECKWSDTFDLKIVFVYLHINTISLSSFCKLIWRHWTYKYACQIYFVECVSKIRHILSVIHYIICGAVCELFTHFPCDD